MKHLLFAGTAVATMALGGVAAAATLDDVKARGNLNCGVNTGLVGFAAPDAEGNWSGFDVAVCRAVAAAVLGDPDAVEYTPLTGKTRFTSLASGEIDLLSRNTTWTFSRDVDLKFTFVGVNYYDGQGFIVSNDLGVGSATELDGATICIQTGTTTELNLADFFRANNISYEPVPIETNAEAQQQYLAGAWRQPVPPLRIRLLIRSFRKSFPRNRLGRSCVTAMTSGPTLSAGALMPWSRLRSLA